eukprot:357431-Chlamydomonas_euryale.AAC.3
MSNQNPAVANNPHPFAIRSQSTEGSIHAQSTQRGRAALFTYSLNPAAVCQLHTGNAAETNRTSDH